MSETKNNIYLSSSDEVTNFLLTRPNPDQEIVWVCPKCGVKNSEAHFCRATVCECGKFQFPRLTLPIRGDSKTTLLEAVSRDRLLQIENEISEYKSEIRNFEGEINEREEWIYELKKERNTLRKTAGLCE